MRCQSALTGQELGRWRRMHILVLLDLRGHCAEGQDDRCGLGWCQGGMLQGMPPQGMMEDRGRTGEEESHSVGQARRGRCAVTRKVTLPRFDRMAPLPRAP